MKYLWFRYFVAMSLTVFSGFDSDAANSCREIFEPQKKGIFKIDDLYLWDNWILLTKNGTYLRYSLSAPTSVGGSDARHANARLRVFTSQDGIQWTDKGVIFDFLTWSGHGVQAAEGSILLFYTKPEIEAHDVAQKIEMAISKEGIRFSDRRTIFDPRDPEVMSLAKELGYHFGTGDGLVSSVRDPHYFEGKIYFATKMLDAKTRTVKPGIGVLHPVDSSFNHWMLEPPLSLPIDDQIRQVEVPNFKRLRNGRLILSVNLTNRKENESSTWDVQSWIRLYEWDSNDHQWRPARGKSLDSDGNLFGPASRIYGFNLLTGDSRGSGNVILGSGFYRSGGLSPHALTPIIQVDLSVDEH